MLNRREAIAASIALAAPRPKESGQKESPRASRVVARLGKDGYLEAIGWGDIRPGDWCMLSDWDQQGRLEGMEAFIAKSLPADDSNQTIQCEPSSLDLFWEEAKRRRGQACDSEPTLEEVLKTLWEGIKRGQRTSCRIHERSR